MTKSDILIRKIELKLQQIKLLDKSDLLQWSQETERILAQIEEWIDPHNDEQ
ncbi:hypothetical protein LCGC14_1482250 [marine sediment metagenome]|uniref:Uncharacterized protein n=1 Tax=marine sediment metagenome TaxID=412755 RepID=A0A0F9LPP7_9ZZZZ